MSRPLPGDIVARLAPHVPREDLEHMRVVTGAPWRYLPPLFRAAAMTFGRRVIFRRGRFRPDTPAGLALIAHEAGHVRQWHELGAPRFVVRYARGLLWSGFRHDDHPMEAPLVAEQRRIRRALEAEGPPVGPPA